MVPHFKIRQNVNLADDKSGMVSIPMLELRAAGTEPTGLTMSVTIACKESVTANSPQP